MIRPPPSRDEILEARLEVNNAHAETMHWRLRLEQAEMREERAMARLSLMQKALSPIGQADAVARYVTEPALR